MTETLQFYARDMLLGGAEVLLSLGQRTITAVATERGLVIIMPGDDEVLLQTMGWFALIDKDCNRIAANEAC